MSRRTGRTLVLGAATVCLVLLSWFRILDQDVDFHVAAGREIAATHAIPRTNVFGYTLPDAPWSSHQWLGSLLIYGAWRAGEAVGAGGAAGLTGTKCAIVLALFGFVYLALRRESWPGPRRFGTSPLHDPIAAAVLVLAAWAARSRLVERPLLLSALFEAVLLWFLAGYERRPARRLTAFLLVLFVVWWNVHAGYIYGVLILAAFIAGDLIEASRRPAALRLARAAAIAIVAAITIARLVNPGSLRGLLFPWRMFRSPLFSSVIDEFRRTTPGTSPAFDALLVLTVTAMVVAAWRGLRPRAAHLLLAGGFAALAVLRMRMILDFSVVGAFLATGTIASLVPRDAPARMARWTAPVVAAALLFAVPWRIARSGALEFGVGFDARARPYAAYDFIQRERVPERVLVADIWSGSFLLRFYPARRVFVHNQLEVYDENFARNIYLPLLRAEEGWQAMLDRVGVNVLVWRYSGARFDQRLATAAFEDPGWALLYWDDTAMVFVRATPANAALIDGRAFRLVNPDHADTGGLLASGKGPDAERELRRVIATNPAATRAWALLGDLLAATGRIEESDAAYREVERRALYPEARVTALAGRARLRLMSGHADEAVSLADQALRLAKGDPGVRAIRAVALFASGHADEATRDARTLAGSPGSAPPDLVMLGQAAAQSGDQGLATSLFDAARSRAADASERRNVLVAAGATWESLGAFPLAERAYREGFALDARDGAMAAKLSRVLGRERRNEEALEFARRATSLAPSDGTAWDALGRAFLAVGRPDSAAAAFERARTMGTPAAPSD